MSGTMPSALHNITSFNPHKNYIKYDYFPHCTLRIITKRIEKMDIGPAFSPTLRYPFHILF